MKSCENSKTYQTTFSVAYRGGYASLALLVVIWEFIHKNYNYLYITFVYFLPLLQEVPFQFFIQ
jgi:hypothetical protein